MIVFFGRVGDETLALASHLLSLNDLFVLCLVCCCVLGCVRGGRWRGGNRHLLLGEQRECS